MLQAGDVLRLQVMHRRGSVPEAPDAAGVEALLRERVAQPSADAVDGQSYPVGHLPQTQALAEPSTELELDMMLSGLSDMGTVTGTVIDNAAGGRFASTSCCRSRGRPGKRAVAGRGPRTDHHRDAGQACGPARGRAGPGQGAAAGGAGARDARGERAGRILRGSRGVPQEEGPERWPTPPAAATATEYGTDLVDLFISPDQFRKERRPRFPQPWRQPVADLHDAAMPVAHDATFIRVSTGEDRPAGQPGGRTGDHRGPCARSSLAEAGNDGRYSNSGLADLSRHTRNLQEAVLAIRMLPISNVFQRFPRVVHELSAPGQEGRTEDVRRGHRAGPRPDREDLRSAHAPGAQRPSAWRRRRRAWLPASPPSARSPCAPASAAATSSSRSATTAAAWTANASLPAPASAARRSRTTCRMPRCSS